LDFSSSKWILFVNRAFINKKIYRQISIFFCFWTSSINFWSFSGCSGILYSLLLLFFSSDYIYFFVFSPFFLCKDPKIGNTCNCKCENYFWYPIPKNYNVN
jgi:hypothetical protein